MPILPVRSLAERGLILDSPPFELSNTAFSNGSNVRFRDGAVRRSSVLRLARDFALPNSRAAWGYSLSTGFDRIFAGQENGAIYEVLENNTVDDVSPPGFSPSVNPGGWTWVQSGDVIYANKPSHVPVYFPGGAATDFAVLPGWDSTLRARAIGASRDQLFAVNLTLGLVAQPNTVALSDYALYGQPPPTWDPLAAGVANRITLAGARSPLVTCLDLDGTMIVYGERQSWRFVFTGDTSNAAQNLWINEPLSNDQGVISVRGVTYYNRRHYVFGSDDLYMHDGVTITPLADEKIRRWVFRNLDAAKADRCFVTVDPSTYEIIFAFPSKDGDAAYAANIGCNRGAVFDPLRARWTLIDLNDVVSADFSNFNPTLLWSEATTPWLTFGGSWADLGDGFARTAMMLGVRTGAARILALDEAANGRVSFDAPATENPTAFVERTGYDLDEAGAPLTTYKIVSTIFPQIAGMPADTVMRIRLGTSLTPQGPYDWSDWQDFSPREDYRVDFNRGGRYLGVRFEVLDPIDFEFSGFDVDLRPGGRR